MKTDVKCLWLSALFLSFAFAVGACSDEESYTTPRRPDLENPPGTVDLPPTHDYLGWLRYESDPLVDFDAHVAELDQKFSLLVQRLPTRSVVERVGNSPLVRVSTAVELEPGTVETADLAPADFSTLPPLGQCIEPGGLVEQDLCGSRVLAAHANGSTGGVGKVAVVEFLFPNEEDRTVINYAAALDDSLDEGTVNSAGFTNGWHLAAMVDVVNLTAPDTDVYIANGNSLYDLPMQHEWALAQGARIQSHSFYTLWDPAGFSDPLPGVRFIYEADAPVQLGFYLDWIVRAKPKSEAALVIMAAGNYRELFDGDFVRNSVFNGLVVGATEERDGDPRFDYSAAVYSAGRNVSDLVNPSLGFPNGAVVEQELPHLAAPGAGTSGATAHTSGIAALLESSGAVPDASPELFRSVLLASADCDVDGLPSPVAGVMPHQLDDECWFDVPTGDSNNGDPCSSGAGTCFRGVCLSVDDSFDGAGMVNATRAETLFTLSSSYDQSGASTANTYVGPGGSLGGTMEFGEDFEASEPCADLIDAPEQYGLDGRSCAPHQGGLIADVPASGQLNFAASWLGGASCNPELMDPSPDQPLGCTRSYPDAVMGIAAYPVSSLDSSGQPVEPAEFAAFHWGGATEVLQVAGLPPGSQWVFKIFKVDGSERTSTTRYAMSVIDGECIGSTL